MATTEITNKIIRGSFGRLWVNGKLMANVKSFECKATLQYEELNVNNNLAKQQRYLGYSVAGTMTLHKVDSFTATLLKSGIKTGSLPSIKMVARLADPDSAGAERIEIFNVSFDELTLMHFENNTVEEESVPFKAGGFEYLDIIAKEE